uniref:SCHIP-1 domain-containing protein n=1 Tax=Steinernema glaseri TaxID=37863 RepID=A0A1I7ZZ06_9BILA
MFASYLQTDANMIYSDPVTSSQPIPIKPKKNSSSHSLPARAGAGLYERVVNTRQSTDAVVARLEELRESSSMSSMANASGSRTRKSERYCDVFDCDLDSDSENCVNPLVNRRQRRETLAKRNSCDSLLEHYDSSSFSGESSSSGCSDDEYKECGCDCDKNAYIRRRFLKNRKSTAAPYNNFNCFSDNSDREMMELDNEDMMPPANICSYGEAIGYANVVRAERIEALQRLENLLKAIDQEWNNKKSVYNIALPQ